MIFSFVQQVVSNTQLINSHVTSITADISALEDSVASVEADVSTHSAGIAELTTNASVAKTLARNHSNDLASLGITTGALSVTTQTNTHEILTLKTALALLNATLAEQGIGVPGSTNSETGGGNAATLAEIETLRTLSSIALAIAAVAVIAAIASIIVASGASHRAAVLAQKLGLDGNEGVGGPPSHASVSPEKPPSRVHV